MSTDDRGANGRRRRLDEWFPTVVRYIGVALLVYAAVFDRGRTPALIPAAAGLILVKPVLGGDGK
jgi:hypothetical protein